MLLVAPGRAAAQVVCGVGLKAKSALLLSPAPEPARCWSLRSRTPELLEELRRSCGPSVKLLEIIGLRPHSLEFMGGVVSPEDRPPLNYF